MIIISFLLVIFLDIITCYRNKYHNKNNQFLSALKSTSNSEIGPDRYSNSNEGPDRNNIQYNAIATNKVKLLYMIIN